MNPETAAPGPHTLAESIPTVCTIQDLCRILQVSRWTIAAQQKSGTFPIPELLPRLGHQRFSGADVLAYLGHRAAPRQLRRVR